MKVFINKGVACNRKAKAELLHNYKIESKNAYHESIKCYNNILVKEELVTYWEDFKNLSSEDLKDYYKKAGYDYII